MRKLSTILLAGKTGLMVQLSSNFINFFAVASSSAANTYFMRKSEMEKGILVKDRETGQEVGVSKIAAQKGVYLTMISRVVYGIPIFIFPGIWNAFFNKVGLLPKTMNPQRVLIELLGVAAGLYIAMPLNCALFPQITTLSVDKLEPDLQTKAKQMKISQVSFNKGL